MTNKFRGVMQSPVTPLKDDFSLDLATFEKVLDFHVRTGATAISWPHHKGESLSLTIAERIDVIAPHPLATLRFDNCRVPVGNRLGEAGQGFKVAMMTLDIFRASVAAAALGFGRAALDDQGRYPSEGLGDAEVRRVWPV